MGGVVVACAFLQRGDWLGLRRCPTGPPSNVFGYRGTRCTPGGGCAPCPLLGDGGGSLRGGGIRLERIPDTKRGTLQDLIARAVKDEAEAIYTDELAAYTPTTRQSCGETSSSFGVYPRILAVLKMMRSVTSQFTHQGRLAIQTATESMWPLQDRRMTNGAVTLPFS